ncbi:hypothetical protein ACFPC0_35685 [Streptomyces andamanensis]|uniref:Uncharacterized protein n=1 Tax=Streptomyces andamanensis TaxID=1565035 RepID=A0ABV8TQV2_9ACTN
MARAGLPEGLLRPAGPVATALAETLAGRVRLLCTEPFARLHGLTWAPLHDTSLHRGYAPRASERQPAAAQVPHWLATVLASGVRRGGAGCGGGPVGRRGRGRRRERRRRAGTRTPRRGWRHTDERGSPVPPPRAARR